MILLKPFLQFLWTLLLTSFNQSAKDDTCALGVRCPKPKGESILCQNCQAKTQEVKIFCVVSSSWSQRRLLHLSPLQSSNFQHLFFIANQRKNLHFRGAQEFHNLFHGSKMVDPLNKTLLWDFEKNKPKASCLHTCISSSWLSSISPRYPKGEGNIVCPQRKV
jgi:hypothetical protein